MDNSVPDHCIYKYKKDNIVREGDFVTFWDGPEIKQGEIIKRGGKRQSKIGIYKHNDIIDKVDYGSKIFQRSGYCVVLKPSSHMYSSTLLQRT